MSGLAIFERRHTILRNVLLGLLVAAAAVLVVMRVSENMHDVHPKRDIATKNLENCVATYRGVVRPAPVTVAELSDIDVFCFNMFAKQLRVEEQILRDEALDVQEFENIVMLWMVVAITVSGVGLAGLQLLSSYLLAKAGRVKFMEDGGTDLSYSHTNVAVKSSVIGVIILTISFAFFLVFVLYLHPVKTLELVAVPVGTSPPFAPTSAPTQIAPPAPAELHQSGPMLPLPAPPSIEKDRTG